MNNELVSKYFFLNKSFLSDRLALKYLLSILFNVYMFIVLFDVTRDGFAIPHIVNILISALRDGALYSLLIYIFATKKSKFHSRYFIFIVFMIFIPIILNISQINFLSEKGQSLRFVLQFCILFAKAWMFLFILVNLDLFYVFDKQNILRTFINITVFIVLFSFLIHFLFPGLKTKTYNIANRVGLGNMSIQTGIYYSSFLLEFYFKPFKSKLYNLFVIILLIFAILLSVTSTGIVCLVLALFGFLFDRKTRNFSFYILLFFFLCIVCVVIIYYDKFEPFFLYFGNKAEEFWDLFINIFNKEKHKTKSSSFGEREKQIARLKNELTLDNLIFGFGYFSQTTHMIENCYYAVLHDFGLYGVLILLTILIKYGIWGILEFLKKRKVLKILSVIGLALYCVTLSVAIVPSIATSFVLLFYFSFFKEEDFYENKYDRNGF